jgi:hypothetical protein
MSGQGKQVSPVSKIIRERALAILRDTRSKIDPKLLEAMKDHLSAAMPGVAPPKPVDENMPLSAKSAASSAPAMPKASAPAAAAAYRQNQPAKPKTDNKFSEELTQALKKAVPVEPEPMPAPYPAKQIDEMASAPVTEPVDKQKIAQIVLQYMKNREEKSKH